MSLTAIISCTKADDTEEVSKPDYRKFNSFSDFSSVITKLASDADNTKINVFWDSLVNNHQVPFIYGDSVAFLYKGNVSSVKWAGDFNGWDPDEAGYTGKLLGNGIWMLVKEFPNDARLDYKIVIEGNNWITDAANPFVQYSGFGPNSELRMPGYIYPQETIYNEETPKGTLSENKMIISNSSNLGYKVQYKVYTPYNYENLIDLPVIYVTDGHEYANKDLGAMIIILDNLISQQMIEPVIAVFIDPRNPDNTGINRRMSEYAANIKFANFVADELVPLVDSEYKTNASPDKRAILGTSMGGWNAAFLA